MNALYVQIERSFLLTCYSEFRSGFDNTMGKALVIFILSFSLSMHASCSSNYAATVRPPSTGYWNSRDPYSPIKGYSRYDQRRESSYGPPPLGPQLPSPLTQKTDVGGFRPSTSGSSLNYHNSLPSDKPSCARKRDYCLHDHDYPMDMVKTVIQRYHSEIYRMYNEMQPHLPYDVGGGNVSYRHNFANDRGGQWACETDIFTMRIGWARNWAGRWKVVLNTDQFPQAVRLEHCKYENRSCQMMPPCVRSSCLQRYTAVQLLSTDPQTPDHSPSVDTFLLPGGCSCYIEFH